MVFIKLLDFFSAIFEYEETAWIGLISKPVNFWADLFHFKILSILV